MANHSEFQSAAENGSSKRLAVWMDLQLNIAETNLSPRKCEQMEEANAREEILLGWCYFVLSGTIAVPP